MMSARQLAIGSMIVLGITVTPLLGCSSDPAPHNADARVADVGTDRNGSIGTGGVLAMGGQVGTGGQSDAAPPAVGGAGGFAGAAGLSADGSSAGGSAGSSLDGSAGGGGVDGGTALGTGGLAGTGGCALFRICDVDDQMLGSGTGWDDPSRCPVERDCYYLEGSCGPTACLLRAGVHCDDPLTCDPGDFPTEDEADCVGAGRCYLKSLCGKNIICSHRIDGGAPVDAANDVGQSLDTVLDGTAVLLDVAESSDTGIDGTTTLLDDAQALDAVFDTGTVSIDAVVCNPTAEYNREYIASSPAICATLRYACADNTTGFENDCGCGCEQDSSCPQYVNCMPGAGPGDPLCDPSSTECPFSIRAM
jgi:hypothetical protein